MSIIQSSEIKLLIELQEKDSNIDELLNQINLIPEQIQQLIEDFEESKKIAFTKKDEILKMQISKKEKEIELGEREEAIKKHQAELNIIRDNKAFKVLLIEIEEAKKSNDSIETEILTLMEEIDKKVLEEKRLQEDLKKMEEEKNEKIKELETNKKILEEKLAAFQKQRKEFVTRIESSLLSRYEYIRQQRKGIAVVRAKEDHQNHVISCGGCNMALTPQTVVDIKKKDIIVLCENCQRIVFSQKTVFES
jgi:predicted  nucleic acid-binding Zn-ribbon protein